MLSSVTHGLTEEGRLWLGRTISRVLDLRTVAAKLLRVPSSPWSHPLKTDCSTEAIQRRGIVCGRPGGDVDLDAGGCADR